MKDKWIVVEEKDTIDIEYRNEDGGGFVLSVERSCPEVIKEVNRIVQCVNSHDELVEALKEAESYIKDVKKYDLQIQGRIEAALAETEKEG